MSPKFRYETAVMPTVNRTVIFLALVAALCLVYYVVQANLLAADTWRLKAAQDQLASLKTDRDGLAADQAQLDDRTFLESLAKEQGLVPVEHTAYLVQEDAVAAAR